MNQTERGTIEDIILSLLLKGESVVFPGFGFLEVVVLPDKKTVLFRNRDSVESVNKEHESQLENVSKLFASGEKVLFDKIGTFTPILVKDAYGRVSFIQSRYLKQVLNGNEEAVLAPKHVPPVQHQVEEVEEKGNELQDVTSVDADKVDTDKKEEVKTETSVFDIVTEEAKDVKDADESKNTVAVPRDFAAKAKEAKDKTAVVNESATLITENVKKNGEGIKKPTQVTGGSNAKNVNAGNRTPLKPVVSNGRLGGDPEKALGDKKKSFRSVYISILLLVIIALGCYFFFGDKLNNASKQPTTKVEPKDVQQEDSSLLLLDDFQTTNLLDLAEKHYGNKVFWVYIYDYNRDRIFSPVNLRSRDTIEIPDLSIYKVDPKDPEEIKKALAIANRQLGY